MLLGFTVVTIIVIFLGLLGVPLFNWLVGFLPSRFITKDKHAFVSKFAVSLIIGLGAWVVLMLFQSSPWLMDIEDASLDLAMLVEQNEIPPATKKDIPPFVFLDIDAQTHKLWGEPLFTPRDKVKKLIEVAVNGGARLVVVDIDLSQKTPTKNSQLHPDDEALKNYLESYIEKCKDKNNNATCPTIILRHSVSNPSSSEVAATVRTSFLDEVVSKEAAPYVQWASRQFYPAEERGVVRRWKLWEPVCKDDKRPMVVPSIELLTRSWVKEDCITQDVQSALQLFQPKNCDSNNTVESLPKTFELCGLQVNTEDRWGINQRIKYRLSWSNLVLDQVDTPVLTVLSAQPYTESPSQKMLKTMTDSIVVIGKSYKEGYDIYSTPLGELPSALIIANGIHTLLLDEKLELSPVKGILTTALFVFLISTLFRIFPSGWGMTVSCALTIFILLPVTMVFFHYGMWLNIALPLIVVTIFQVVVKANDAYLKNLWLIVRR
jgi:CHASE2 domain-containing sensor protein